jgi:uncharacterized membrane-anchored protein
MNEVKKLWQQLSQANLVIGDYPELEGLEKPWYLRLLQGVAGWFAGFLMLGFFALMFSNLFNKDSHTLLMVVGVLCSVAAYLVFKSKRNDFLNQMAMALSLAGQIMFAFAVFESIFRISSSGLFILAAYQMILVFFLPNYMHRLLTSGFALIAFVTGLHELGLAGIGGAVSAVALSLIWLKDKKWSQYQPLWEPVGYGLSIALVYSQVFILSQRYLFRYKEIDTSSWLVTHAAFISSLLVAVVFINLVWVTLKEFKVPLKSKEAVLALLFCCIVVTMSFYIIGMSTGLLLILLGFIRNRKVLIAIGIFSALGFISWYYYNLHMTLLLKSLILIGIGIAMLVAYALFNYFYSSNKNNKSASFRFSFPTISQWVVVATVVLVLGAVTLNISKKEDLIAHGDKLLFRLGPVDPRSIMQGDYMRLRFDLATQITAKLQQINTQNTIPQYAGFAVVEKDDKGIVNFVDLYHNQDLSQNQFMIPYKNRNHQIHFTTNAFYFQEGMRKHYQQARFGEFRYKNGEMLLVNMVDKDFVVL